MQADGSLLKVCRYAEPNALTTQDRSPWDLSLAPGRPFGDDGRTARAAAKLGLEHTIRNEASVHARKPRDGTNSH